MYASWRSDHTSASSREIAWFCPSGSSVTTKVERLERLTTSVWTLRLPYAVGVAFGIAAASAFSSSGLGLSYTVAASGSLNCIFATDSPRVGIGTVGLYPIVGSEIPVQPTRFPGLCSNLRHAFEEAPCSASASPSCPTRRTPASSS
jgi:hypothetical protein